MSDEPQAFRLFILPLLPSTRAVRLTGMTIDGEDILLQLTTTTPSAGCPHCSVPSSSVHSRYQRHLTDVPWGSRPVRLQLTVRKFVCRNPRCPRRIFTERVPELVAAYARKALREEGYSMTSGMPGLPWSFHARGWRGREETLYWPYRRRHLPHGGDEMITPRPGFLVVLALLSGCATTPVPQAHHIVRLETCLAAVARIDPGPIDGVIDAQLQAGLQRYYESFVATDLMALGRDPRSAEVEHAAFRALLYRCWREGKLPPGDPLAGMDPASQGPP